MTKFDRLTQCLADQSNLGDLDRVSLIELYYKYSPRECVDLIDTGRELKRINTIELEELRNEVNFYMNTYGY